MKVIGGPLINRMRVLQPPHENSSSQHNNNRNMYRYTNCNKNLSQAEWEAISKIIEINNDLKILKFMTHKK